MAKKRLYVCFPGDYNGSYEVLETNAPITAQVWNEGYGFYIGAPTHAFKRDEFERLTGIFLKPGEIVEIVERKFTLKKVR